MVVVPPGINSFAIQLNMSLYELKLLKFFQSACVPLFLFNIDKLAAKRYSVDIAPYVAALPCVRNSVFALACLMLWPQTNFKLALCTDSPRTFLSHAQRFPRDLSHLYLPVGEGANPDANLLVHTLSYFDQSVVSAQEHISMLYLKSQYNVLDSEIFHFNSEITYVFLGLLPNLVMPLFDPTAECPLDLLQYATNNFELSIRVLGNNHIELEEARSVQRFITFDRKRWTSSTIHQLRAQLSAEYFGNTTFIEINSQICREFGILEDHINILEYLLYKAHKFGAPSPIFEFPFMLRRDFVLLVRAHNEFALRLLLVFACLGVYCGFYILKKKNVWAEYIDWFCSRSQPMCDFDARLIHYMHVRDYRTDFVHFRSWLQKFESIWDQTEDDGTENELERILHFPLM